eukprot:CAMPEP_0197055340 /NCGR_PEP_ID=MMETSP1384-20130603/63513_1 /TAXON_ID=29189 /ORGANISM="Ammonia sp." /LENGTH=229 /DNA_ID=CAMNT_0042488883 /DNA_START=32 /DNA_END=721 /DNA_ORIENTATION=-
MGHDITLYLGLTSELLVRDIKTRLQTAKCLMKVFQSARDSNLMRHLPQSSYKLLVSFVVDIEFSYAEIMKYAEQMRQDMGIPYDESYLYECTNKLIQKYTEKYLFNVSKSRQIPRKTEVGYIRYSAFSNAPSLPCSPYQLFGCQAFNGGPSGDGSAFQITFAAFSRAKQKLKESHLQMSELCCHCRENKHAASCTSSSSCDHCHALQWLPILQAMFDENQFEKICIVFG